MGNKGRRDQIRKKNLGRKFIIRCGISKEGINRRRVRSKAAGMKEGMAQAGRGRGY